MKHASESFDVVVVGGGHAGCEAAHAAWRRGACVGLITHRRDRIGEMSCNPAVGGVGKGHLVREVDALGGLIGRVADRAGLQFRLLNRRKGPAVQGPRAQCCRTTYRKAMQAAILGQSGLVVVEGEVVDLVVVRGGVGGVVLADGTRLGARSVVVTAGTFLNAIIYCGEDAQPAGRAGDQSSTRLAKRIADFGFRLGRLKTGTPPRLEGRTVDFKRLDKQPGDCHPAFLSSLTQSAELPQQSCYITDTNEQTHAIVLDGLTRSPRYREANRAAGPRYCPSLEDKVVRFPNRQSHRIFLEPEAVDSTWIYPNGISNALPVDVQLDLVRSINGLERCEIARPGYAVEYDYIDPRELTSLLSARNVGNLFLAGQVNGTTGYEEAAAQGLMAGINAAAHALGLPEVRLGREQAYIGVLIDDLITQGVTEPYRMFTSRAEFRLSLRADNADQRLTPLGIQIGCVGEWRTRLFLEKQEDLARGRQALREIALSPPEARRHGIELNADGRRRTGMELLSLPNVELRQVAKLSAKLTVLRPETLEQLEREARYLPYIGKQRDQMDALAGVDGQELPVDLDYDEIGGLSNELRQKLQTVRPETFGQAGRIEGMTPTALALLHFSARKLQLNAAIEDR